MGDDISVSNLSKERSGKVDIVGLLLDGGIGKGGDQESSVLGR